MYSLICQMISVLEEEELDGVTHSLVKYCRGRLRTERDSKVIFCEKCMKNDDFPDKIGTILDDWGLSLEEATGGVFIDCPLIKG